MRFRKTLAGIGAAGAVSAVFALSGGTAYASSFGCNAQVGCATAHSTQAAYPASYAGSRVIAIDAKKQSAAPGTAVIGYPDLVQDKATSFDKVAHVFHSGALAGDTFYTFVYAPTGNWSDMCLTASPVTGKVTLQVCTLGHDPYQQFAAGKVGTGTIQWPVSVPNFPGATRYIFANLGGVNLSTSQDLPAAFGNAKLLEDTFTGSPLIPVAVGAPDGRQLDVGGTISAGTDPAATVTGPSVTGDQHNGYAIAHVSVPANAQWIWHT